MGILQSDHSNPHVDNLYFDMNRIIHPRTHPTNEKQQLTETEMFNSIFEYVDRLIRIIRPKQMI